ncbi:MAG TPA: hypothetical protein VNR66_04575 [Solirubrobacteraceae bacterium]|nr:hypothetical protein [Solirubrobacteraceae bacterium]
MRTPIRSEREAFRLVFGTVAVIAVAVVLGVLTTAWVGVAVLIVAIVAAAAAYLRAENPDRREALGEAARESHPAGSPAGTRHVLVVANETLSGDELRRQITRVDPEHTEIDVLVPVLTSRVHYAVTDIDRERVAAQARLNRSLRWAEQCGIVARGEVGDPSPASALEDRLRAFGADEVIVVTHPREHESWQEQGELKRLRRELDVPVTHVSVGGPVT